MSFDVAVIGLGAHGSATLAALARRGVSAIGVEAVAPAHDGGSSHGESRIIRTAYFEHPSYVPLCRRAFEAWRALERETGRSLLTMTGILEAGIPGAEIVTGSLGAAIEHGLAHERLTPAQVAERFPAFDLPAHWEAVYQPEAGILRPEAGVEAHLAVARANGARIRTGVAVERVEPARDGVTLRLSDGEVIRAHTTVLTAGAWVNPLLPAPLPLTLTRQSFAWFTPAERDLTTPEVMPVFLLEDELDAVYGFPDFDGSGVKAGSHIPGRVLSRAEDARQDAGPEDAAPLIRMLSQRIPAAAGPVRAQRTCIYASTPDGDFIVDRHPEWPRLVIGSACSGHGYKFAPVIGEALARLAFGEEAGVGFERFGIARFEKSAQAV